MTVGAERHSDHGVLVAGQGGADLLAGVGIPHPHRLVEARSAKPVTVRAKRHTIYRAGVAGDDLEGAGSLGHRGVERAVVGRKGQGARGENLLERPRVPTGLVTGQHVLRLGDQNLPLGNQLLLQQALCLVSRLERLPTEHHRHQRDDGGDRRHGNEDP